METHAKREGTASIWRWGCLALLATAWGMNELVAGETLWLTTFALLVLAAARALWNRPGSSTAIALIAVGFRAVNTAPFFCHLLGIAVLGIAFDLTATLLMRGERRIALRGALTGLVGAYASHLSFAVLLTWIIRYEHWAAGGFDRVREHVLGSGSAAALLSLVVVPLGFWVGTQLRDQAVRRPRWAFGTAATLCAVGWALGPVVS